jgi:hypothetical protein
MKKKHYLSIVTSHAHAYMVLLLKEKSIRVLKNTFPTSGSFFLVATELGPDKP